MTKNLTKVREIAEEVNAIAEEELAERVVAVDRVSRTVAGGRRIRFRALIVIGNRKDSVGVGLAKGNDVQIAIAKARALAKKSMVRVPLKDETIPHEVKMRYGSTTVILKPAPKGHSIIAGGAVRPVLELAGVKNIVSKSLGSSNAVNNALATFMALRSLKR